MNAGSSVLEEMRGGFAAWQAGNLAAAGEACLSVLRQQPDNFEAMHLLAVLLLQTGRTEQGVNLLMRVVALNADFAPAHVNLGNGYRDLKRPDEALLSYDRAITVQPEFAEAWGNRGNALTELRRYDEALASFDRALMLRPDFAEAWSNRARALLALGRDKEAAESASRAVALNPRMASAQGNLGHAFNKLRLFDRAADAYAQVLALQPEYPFIRGLLLYQRMHACDWKNLSVLAACIENDIEAGKPSADPFGWQAVSASPASLKACAEIFAAKKFPSRAKYTHRPRHSPKIRIGYLSGEFREHATSLLMAGVWEHHDKDRFEVFAFDNGRNDGSRTRQRIEAAMDKIVPISHLGNSQAAAAIFENEIDILVNLNGYFGGERSLIFAERPAPIQVNYLGFPGTLGADYFDYLVADDVVIPESERKFYSEKIVTLPGSYQANDRTKAIAGDMTRAECGLPENGFIFCCFNNNYKILPSIFEIWMRLLAHCENSVLWLLNDNDVAVRNLRQEAHLRGIRPERLIFADRMPLSLHLARHRLADLFLDTLPYNAHTTASDALWAGLPLVTCRGTTFPGRVAASLLTAMDLPELIADNLRDYEKLATGLAHNPDRLHAIRNKLQANRLAKPLFDTQGFTRNLETAYQAMNNRFLSGDSPDNIVVPDVGTYVGTSKGWPF